MSKKLREQNVEFIKIGNDNLMVKFTGRFICELLQDVSREIYPFGESMHWRVYQLKSGKLFIFTDHRKGKFNVSNVYVYDSLAEIIKQVEIEGVSTYAISKLIRDSMK